MDDFINCYLDSIDKQTDAGDTTDSNQLLELQNYERFLVFAQQNPERVQEALNQLEREKGGRDERRKRPASLTALMPMDGITGFPTNIKERWTPKKLWEQYDPSTLPKILVGADIDSIYTFNSSLFKLVESCGEKCRFTMPNITRHQSADTGTRFCVNSDLCETKPFIRGGEAKTVPLNWFPNVKIATVQIGHPFHSQLHIQLYFLGVDGLHSNTYFTQERLGVVNAMFTMAAISILDDPDFDRSIKRQLARFYNLETLVGSRKWTGARTSFSNSLTPSAMRALALKSTEVLELMATNDEATAFEMPFFNGIQPEDKREKTLNREAMVKFAQELQKSMCFTASMAGCKGSFADEHFLRKIELDPEQFRKVDQDDQMETDDHSIKLDPDQMGTETKSLKVALDGFDSEDDLDDQDSEEDSDESSESTAWDCDLWCSTINEKLTETRNELKEVVLRSFREAFDSNLRSSKGGELPEPKLHSESTWYIDFGIETMLESDTMNIFPMIDSSEALLKEQLKEL